MSDVVALFLFNHHFEGNIDKLDAMYRDRFGSRRYIMPFSQSERPDVIPVYETSLTFSGHLCQAWPRVKVDGATHYVVIADDLILHPRLHEGNLLAELGLGQDSGYIKSLASIDRNRYRWFRALAISMAFDEIAPGFDHFAELPDRDYAADRFRKMGIPLGPPTLGSWRDLDIKARQIGPLNYLRWISRRTSFPLLYGYSDFLVVPAAAMDAFAHYCGILAALNVFAEAAVPTALALAVDDIVTELPLGEDFMPPYSRNPGRKWHGMEFWAPGDAANFERSCRGSIERMLGTFSDDQLYVHPVKLSRFD